jgi:hypothetical protein
MKALAFVDRDDPGRRQLLDQPVLKGPERPLGAAPGLGRIGPDVLDPQLRQRPADLGETAAVDLARLGGAEIMRAAIRLEAHRQAVFAEDLLQRPKGRGGAFLLDQKGRVDRPRRVVERDNQIERRLALEPRVPRAVLMQHHPRQRPPLALAPVRPLARRLGHQPFPLKVKLRPGVAQPKP